MARRCRSYRGMHRPMRSLIVLAAVVFGACAPAAKSPEGQWRERLKQARSAKLGTEQRAVLCLDAASDAARLLGSDRSGEARAAYNQAAAELVVLLRAGADGAYWNRPLTLAAGGATYRLRFAKATRDGIWDPGWFTSFTPADAVDMDSVKNRYRQEGVGGALVGVRRTSPLESFSPLVGVTAPVTAVLDFKGNDVTLSLVDPTKKSKAAIAGRERVLEADFSAPLAYYPHQSELWQGLMGALHVADHMKITGLYMLEPYDPDRIPLVFIHGLISTPRMWRDVINEIETDPVIRRNYQCMVFAYPTGNPPAYSALRLREELAKYRGQHPGSRDMVLVGHSMGGLLSRMQVTTITREDWDVIGKDKAARLFARVKPGDIVHRCAIIDADPHIDRAVFICTPHRGSKMAVGTLGELAIRLISLPVDIASAASQSMGASISIITGDPGRVPTSIDGLSPRNPALKVYDSNPIEVPHHSIIGDRGKGDTPNSSDGVVEYWSSHLKSADSEKIVPGTHGAFKLPECIAELRRILHLHLKQAGGAGR
jgi:pimeloyl-ACP methyl ester carboxylesterase